MKEKASWQHRHKGRNDKNALQQGVYAIVVLYKLKIYATLISKLHAI
jgi:hypothetical protein